jgi:hypothetical protein
MLHYWLSVFILAIQQTFTFIGKTRGGLVFDCCVVVLVILRLWKKHGWREMRKKIRETVGEGLLIALIAWFLVFIYHFIAAPYELQLTADNNTGQINKLLLQKGNALISCQGDLRVQTEKSGLLQSQRDAQQVTINSQQGQLNSQQGTMNSCVVSLGKMNPLINTKFAAWSWPIMDHVEQGPGSLHATHWLELVITTNHTSSPTGTLKCDKPFIPVESPKIAASISDVAAMAFLPAKAISDREYEVKVSMTGVDWGPNNPIYFRATSESSELGTCSFTPQQ